MKSKWFKARWFRVGRIRGIGASLYVSRWVLAFVAALAALSWDDPLRAAIAVASYLAVIFVHEFGHAWMARHLSYEVVSVRVGLIHGRCEFESPHTEVDDVLIAWAGVLAQLSIAIPVLIIAAIFAGREPGYAGPVVSFLGNFNLMIALVNLVPGPGFDGATAWRAIPLAYSWMKSRTIARRTLKGIRGKRRTDSRGVTRIR